MRISSFKGLLLRTVAALLSLTLMAQSSWAAGINHPCMPTRPDREPLAFSQQALTARPTADFKDPLSRSASIEGLHEPYQETIPAQLHPGAIGSWAGLLPALGPLVTLVLAAGVEGSAIGLIAWFSPTFGTAAVTGIALMIIHADAGTLGFTRWGRWKRVRSFHVGTPLRLIAAGFTTSLSLLAFIPGAYHLPLMVTLLTAVVPHVSANAAIVMHQWNHVPFTRLGLEDVSKLPRFNDEQDLRISYTGLKTLDDTLVRVEKPGHPAQTHRLKVWYFRESKTWEIEIRPIEGLSRGLMRVLAEWNLPGSQSGQILFRFHANRDHSEVRILSGTEIFHPYRDLHLYKETMARLLNQLPKPILIWHSLDEIESLRDLYDAIPPTSRQGYPASANDQMVAWRASGIPQVEFVPRLRQIVWKAFYRHQLAPEIPVIPEEAFERLKLVRIVKGPTRHNLRIVADHGGGLYMSSWVGDSEEAPLEPWREPPEWLNNYWAALMAQNPVLMMRSPAEETRVREWETQFALRFEGRFFRTPPEELFSKIRDLMRTQLIDTLVMDRFLFDLVSHKDLYRDNAALMRHFHDFLREHDYIQDLNDGWLPVLYDLPELERWYATQTYQGRPAPLFGIRAHWMATLMRQHIPLSHLLEAQARVETNLKNLEAHIQAEHQASHKLGRGKKPGEAEALERTELDKQEIAERIRIYKLEIDQLVDAHFPRTLPPDQEWVVRARLVGFLIPKNALPIHKLLYALPLQTQGRGPASVARDDYFAVTSRAFRFKKKNQKERQSITEEKWREFAFELPNLIFGEKPPSAEPEGFRLFLDTPTRPPVRWISSRA